ncbi:MAG: RagB/SusD family nutrient uptake outer membrane protein [Bacteroidales bacterium]|nr:RagB/SusD family nutrient uptake outer membrane protein [Bacteroidales bacterium]
MKKHLFYISLILIFLSAGLSSCKKFLNDVPQTSLTSGNAYKSANDVENALAGCYSTFYTDYYQWEDIMLGDVRSDNAYPGGGGEDTFVDVDLFKVPPSNSHDYQFWWGQPYQAIASCNILLDKINGVTDPNLTETRRKQIIGEASFLRAFNYYQLVKLFGGVPIELHSNTANPAVTRKPRATEKQVYDQIVSDLQTAVDDLPNSYGDLPTDKTRATKGAAYALLAKVWAQRSDRDYKKVIAYCDSVINDPEGYALVPNYHSLFDGSNYFNSEAILVIPFVAGSAASNWGVELFLAPEDGWQKYCVPSKNLVNTYLAEGDTIRMRTNIIFYKNIMWADENWNPCDNPDDSVPFNYKSEHPDNWASGDDIYLLRLADIITLKAEAQNELGDLAGAEATLNLIRHRVDLPDVVASSQDEMRSKILLERRLELAFEGQRWDDLVRAGVATTVMTNLKEYKYTCDGGVPSAPISIVYNCDKNHWLMPIPQAEIDANPNLTQNPGY